MGEMDNSVPIAGVDDGRTRVRFLDEVRVLDRVSLSATSLGLPLDYVSDVVASAAGRVYILKRSDPPVVVTDGVGTVIDTWGAGILRDPHHGCIDHEDRLWVVDRDAHCVIRFDRHGEIDMVLGQKNEPISAAPFNHPTGVAVAPNGEIVVSDGYGNSNVHCFGPGGDLLRSWGTPGSSPGSFSTPHAVVVNNAAVVYIADRENDRIQSFTLTGEYVGEIGDVYRPMGLAVDWADRLYVTDQVPRLTVFNGQDRLVSRCRPAPYVPHGITITRTGDVVIAESAPENNVVLLRKS